MALKSKQRQVTTSKPQANSIIERVQKATYIQ
jgi:hypothetical protein